jgi:hemerythrin-like domain-containing protein
VLLTQLDDAAQTFLTSGAVKEALVITLRALVRLYVDHIWKEDYILLPMADKVLSDNDHAKLCEQFDPIEAGLGAGKHRQLEGLSERLEHALAKEPIK